MAGDDAGNERGSARCPEENPPARQGISLLPKLFYVPRCNRKWRRASTFGTAGRQARTVSSTKHLCISAVRVASYARIDVLPPKGLGTLGHRADAMVSTVSTPVTPGRCPAEPIIRPPRVVCGERHKSATRPLRPRHVVGERQSRDVSTGNGRPDLGRGNTDALDGLPCRGGGHLDIGGPHSLV